jgi:WD40 repeat protein
LTCRVLAKLLLRSLCLYSCLPAVNVNVNVNSNMMVTGSYDNKIRMWNASGECERTFSGHDAPVKSIDLHNVQGGHMLCVSASQDRTVRAWLVSVSSAEIDDMLVID